MLTGKNRSQLKLAPVFPRLKAAKARLLSALAAELLGFRGAPSLMNE